MNVPKCLLGTYQLVRIVDTSRVVDKMHDRRCDLCSTVRTELSKIDDGLATSACCANFALLAAMRCHLHKVSTEIDRTTALANSERNN